MESLNANKDSINDKEKNEQIENKKEGIINENTKEEIKKEEDIKKEDTSKKEEKTENTNKEDIKKEDIKKQEIKKEIKKVIIEKSALERSGMKIMGKVPYYLNCIACHGLCVDPYEFTCGHGLICEDCIEFVDFCPKCNVKTNLKKSIYINMTINKISVKCEFCHNFVSDFERVRTHTLNCLKREFECNEAGCKYKSKKQDFLKHISENHTKELITHFITERKDSETFLMNDKNNDLGNNAKIGENGKYYCEQEFMLDLDEKSSDQESDQKPPNSHRKLCRLNGKYNCCSCMKLDLEIRNLPKGFLVNGDGIIAQYQEKFETFICGKELLDDCTSRCSYRRLCDACKTLNKVKKLYSQLFA